jgi:nucleoside 2-deoxyribosyltransferase
MSFRASPSCYLAIPSDAQFAPVREAVLEALRELEVEPLEESDLSKPSSPRETLERADFVIADVTGSSRSVLYELGAANALRKPVLIFSQEHSEVPPELGKMQVIVYSLQQISELRDYVTYWIKTTLRVQRSRYVPAVNM